LINVIWETISGNIINRTPHPQRIMNDIHGIPVNAWSFTKAAAVTANTGLNADQMKGIE